MRIFGVIGWKNSGKTGLMVRLISEITSRGFSVSSVKHAHHRFSLTRLDEEGHDLLPPGAQEAIFSSAERWSHLTAAPVAQDPKLSDLLPKLGPVDLVLVEGYKLEGHPKIEAFRPETGNDLIARTDPRVLAVATTGQPAGLTCPVFHLDDTRAIADFILEHVGLEHAATSA
ncbi:molybdopterin-guanine dinucleotide biosynthesis protein B [Maliponia aquimaris]|uniref:Molybdopterin-guanine dinucleotide biosynthesis adapter protein n=1 Tax=Maliponia aquimaris TaxID=1673631 RepID=A0A238KZ26_9RHOB|nr:molybdopterin-guanine dinucleotide biosynthesis protein B [Maliponia aquimaris]SMX48084.1 Molybdopterin-guanine dinucleotide biosynthesis adapter protein [Maliponia aquimaris]